MKTDLKKTLPLALAILAGAAGGFMRGKELSVCYNDTTGLYTAAPITWALLILSAVVCVAGLALALTIPRNGRAFSTLYRCGTAGALLGVLSGGLIVVAGLVRIAFFFGTLWLSAFFIGLLTVIAGISVIALTAARRRGNMPYMTAFGAVVVVFWASFMMIQVFMEHPVEPALLLFAYDLLAMCFALLAIYGVTAQIFARDRAQITLFAALGAVYFLLVSGFGRLVAFLYTGNLSYLTQVSFRLMIYAALLPYCISMAGSLLLHMGDPDPVPEPEEPAENEEEHEV